MSADPKWLVSGNGLKVAIMEYLSFPCDLEKTIGPVASDIVDTTRVRHRSRRRR
jgi:hypothetical protein